MKRTGIRKLALNKETLRRLVADDLSRVAGGRGGCCTYRYSGCVAAPTATCGATDECNETVLCDTNGCL